MKRYVGEIIKRKDLVLYLVTSGLKAQHRNSFLGYFWWLLDPLLNVFIYYFVVVVIFGRGGEGFGAYLVVGMIAWRWHSSTVTTSAKSITGKSGIISQVYLPKIIFPIGTSLTQIINFSFGLIIMAIFLAFFRILPGWEVLWMPVIILVQFVFQTALASIIAYVCVFIRDVDTLIGHIMRLWFFGSPVIWEERLLPEQMRWLAELNPVSHLLGAYRNVLLYEEAPNIAAILIIAFISSIILIMSTYYYDRNEYRIIKAL